MIQGKKSEIFLDNNFFCVFQTHDCRLRGDLQAVANWYSTECAHAI